jgi:hypothetical protein
MPANSRWDLIQGLKGQPSESRHRPFNVNETTNFKQGLNSNGVRMMAVINSKELGCITDV